MNTQPNPLADSELVFLKLGGSLITDKYTPRTARPAVLERLAHEIKAGLKDNPGVRILLGHGSGSFGHTSGEKYQTRDGVSTPEEWLGFTEVWNDAADLNRMVMSAFRAAGLPTIAFPPSSSILAQNRKIVSWDLHPLQKALDGGLLPVVYGDVVFDESLGGTILSTEDLFVHLAPILQPERILLAGQDPGVWADFPECTNLFEEITPLDRGKLRGMVQESRATDVTGGMGDKVNQMLDLIQIYPHLEALIFSGTEAGHVRQALIGDVPGTYLHS